MSNTAQARIFTLEEWDALPEDDARELVDGILVEGEMPFVVHEVVIVWLIRVLGAWAVTHGARVLGSGVKLGLEPRRGRLADASVYLRDVRRPPARGVVKVPPSIAIEVVSPSASDARRDRIEKLARLRALRSSLVLARRPGAPLVRDPGARCGGSLRPRRRRHGGNARAGTRMH